jgi:DNA-directed RNA polymerase specialized sigma24 family protein
MPGRYVTEAIYDRLRSIGVSVETADALAPVVAGLSPRKREAFFLWAMGYTERQAADQLKVSHQYINQLKKYFKCLLAKCC